MIYVFILFMLGCGFYTLTYGVSLIRDDKNKLGGIAVSVYAVTATIAPIVVLLMKS